MSLRVIAGSLKGRRLATPDWPGLRPTSDRLRETLFNIVAPRIASARVIDGYAGTGAVGIEALSRGASHVTFIEADPRAVRLIEQNLDRCGIDPEADDRCSIIRGSFTNVVRAAPTAPMHRDVDLILLDPPYDEPDIEAVLVAAAHVLAPSGLIVLEHARRRVLPASVDGLRLARTVPSGDSALAIFGTDGCV